MLLPRYYLTNLQNLPDGIGISPAMCYEWLPSYHVEKLLSFPLVRLSYSGKSRFSSSPLIFVGESWLYYIKTQTKSMVFNFEFIQQINESLGANIQIRKLFGNSQYLHENSLFKKIFRNTDLSQRYELLQDGRVTDSFLLRKCDISRFDTALAAEQARIQTENDEVDHDVWTLQPNKTRQIKEFKRRKKESKSRIEEMAVSNAYDRLTQERLQKLFETSIGGRTRKKKQTIGDALRGGSIVELASGSARNMRTYGTFDPQSVHLVDKNEEGYNGVTGAQTSALSVSQWILKNYSTSFIVCLDIWLLCYMSKREVNELLRWAKRNAKYLILVEPIHPKPGKERLLNAEQQMIQRPFAAYEKLFKEYGFQILQSTKFTIKGEANVGSNTYSFVLEPLPEIKNTKTTELKSIDQEAEIIVDRRITIDNDKISSQCDDAKENQHQNEMKRRTQPMQRRRDPNFDDEENELINQIQGRL